MNTINEPLSYKLDLHCHSTASDGVLSPTQIIELALERGITTLALTDHDTLEGLDEARVAVGERLELIEGIEFGCHMPFGEMHMLGYLFDPDYRPMLEWLEWLRNERKLRGRRMVEKLHANGINISWERVREIAGEGSVGRPHVSQALVESGYATDTNDAFEKYIGWGRPGYIERVALTPVEVVRLVRAAGGVVSVAHPGRIPDLEGVLQPLIEAGLIGLECYYGEYDDATVQRLVTVADSLALVPTGGSDYHGYAIKDHAELGQNPRVPADTVERLKARQ